ncbi:lipid-binding SYLF domain-containing protein [Lichenicoccus roseus]|uniref:Lipid-binding SYLF domain-containing protein n=1 Tax=Lichenicoccus roseus TaxID=2683649 RepID=A0A5R9J9W9_9PROT|nr:lipid-binding SYLF domain-containing protein [Lichenicoccus roseus]TLU73347.1 lipid-binding SYLF domain-containing protein [Lichenicoccus roseus]
MRTRRGLAAVASIVLPSMVVLQALPTAAHAQGQPPTEAQEQQQRLVDRATLTAQDILDWRANGDQARRFLARSRGVLICPSIFRMSFIFGGSGGGCTLLARDGSGSWSAPAFYSMGSGSFGLQAGIQDAELMLFIMSRRGLTAIMDSQFKFGANAGITLATLGAGMEGDTSAAFNADIVVIEKSKGLFAGISLQGSILSFDSIGNRAYYGQPVGPQDIAVAMRVNNPGADPLRAVLMRYGGAGPATPPPAIGPDAGEASNPDNYPPAYRRGTAYGAPNAYQGSPAYQGGQSYPANPDTGPTQLAPSDPVQSQSLPPPR